MILSGGKRLAHDVDLLISTITRFCDNEKSKYMDKV